MRLNVLGWFGVLVLVSVVIPLAAITMHLLTGKFIVDALALTVLLAIVGLAMVAVGHTHK